MYKHGWVAPAKQQRATVFETSAVAGILHAHIHAKLLVFGERCATDGKFDTSNDPFFSPRLVKHDRPTWLSSAFQWPLTNAHYTHLRR